MKIVFADSINGKVDLPGDKSISHRAAIFAAMSQGRTKIKNFSGSADCRSTLECLRLLGVSVEQSGTNVAVEGVGKAGFSKPNGVLNCGNSGTTMRLLAGVLAGQNFETVLVGDKSLSRRPMKRIIKPLYEMGATVESESGTAPLGIYGKNPLKAISYKLPIASAQIKSAILLAGLNGDGATKIINPTSKEAVSSSRNHTELLLRYLGADIGSRFVEVPDGFVEEITLDGDSRLTGRDLVVPSDVSAAAFFIVAASVIKGSDIDLPDVGVNPTRTAFIEILKKFGANIEFTKIREANGEPIADIRIKQGDLCKNPNRMELKGDQIPNLIDEIPILAVLGTQLQNGLRIRDAKELRVKESDRIASVAENLKRMGADVIEYDDGFSVENSDLKGAIVDSFGDHRIAMAFAIAGLFASGETEIIGSECVGISFPDFFEVLANVVK